MVWSAPHVDNLSGYGFERISNLWELRRRDIPATSGLYAFVACGDIKSAIYSTKINEQNEIEYYFDRFNAGAEIGLNDVFYVGRAQKTNLQTRLDNYRSQGKKGTPAFYTRKFDQPHRHSGTRILQRAWTQQVPIDVFVKPIRDDIVFFNGVPLDPLVGMEAALIRLLNPIGNREFR